MDVRAPDVAQRAAVTEAISASPLPQQFAPESVTLRGPNWLAWVHSQSVVEHARAASELLGAIEASQGEAARMMFQDERRAVVELSSSQVRLRLAALVELSTERYEVTAAGAFAAGVDV